MFGPSPDATHVLYYDDGTFYTFDLATGKSYDITKQIPSAFYDVDDDHNTVKLPLLPDRMVQGFERGAAFRRLGYLEGRRCMAALGVNLTANGKAGEKIRYHTRVFQVSMPDEKGIDLSQPIYIEAYGEWTKKGGASAWSNRASLGNPDAALGRRPLCQTLVVKAKHADVFLYTRETTQDFPNFYLSDAKLTAGARVTDANPQQKNILWSSGVKVIDYTSEKGDKLQAALFLPANYEPGKTYPAIVYIYEKLSQAANNYAQPTFNGFNIANYTSNGYAVLTPDIVYKVNDPGMSAVWCILPALKAAEATGVVDAKRVGIHGHSWGGYQTARSRSRRPTRFTRRLQGAPLGPT